MPRYNSRNSLERPCDREAHLWEEFKNGSEAAFTSIYQQYAYLLYSYGNKISSDATLVEDCIQELFIKLWVNKAKLGEAPSLKNYLLKAFRRLLRDAIQKNKPTTATSGQELDFKLTLRAQSEEVQQQSQLEKERKLQLAIEKLSARQKEVIYLRFYKKM